MGKRNKFLLNEAQVFGQKFVDLSGYVRERSTRFSADIADLVRKKLKARKLKKVIKKRLTSFSKLKEFEVKYQPGKLFQPCSYGFWNSVVAENRVTRVGGILELAEVIGTDGRSHGFGGCGDCAPLTKEEVEKQRQVHVRYFEGLGRENSMYSAIVTHYKNVIIAEDGTSPNGCPCP